MLKVGGEEVCEEGCAEGTERHMYASRNKDINVVKMIKCEQRWLVGLVGLPLGRPGQGLLRCERDPMEKETWQEAPLNSD